MYSSLVKFKRDLAKHRGKAAVLGVLFVAMVVLGARAYLVLQPSPAVAGVMPAKNPVPGLSKPVVTEDAQEKIRQSNQLWRSLLTVDPDAVDAKVAFTFNASFYPEPMVPVVARPILVTATQPEAAPVVLVDDGSAKAARIREQARALVIKSTAVGSGSIPMVIINQQLLTLGQKILGFEITAIRAREVEFSKEGVTTVVKMPDGQ